MISTESVLSQFFLYKNSAGASLADAPNVTDHRVPNKMAECPLPTMTDYLHSVSTMRILFEFVMA